VPSLTDSPSVSLQLVSSCGRSLPVSTGCDCTGMDAARRPSQWRPCATLQARRPQLAARRSAPLPRASPRQRAEARRVTPTACSGVHAASNWLPRTVAAVARPDHTTGAPETARASFDARGFCKQARRRRCRRKACMCKVCLHSSLVAGSSLARRALRRSVRAGEEAGHNREGHAVLLHGRSKDVRTNRQCGLARRLGGGSTLERSHPCAGPR
jgi:hypothetical protein